MYELLSEMYGFRKLLILISLAECVLARPVNEYDCRECGNKAKTIIILHIGMGSLISVYGMVSSCYCASNAKWECLPRWIRIVMMLLLASWMLACSVLTIKIQNQKTICHMCKDVVYETVVTQIVLLLMYTIYYLIKYTIYFCKKQKKSSSMISKCICCKCS
jgi:hypothetical protein